MPSNDNRRMLNGIAVSAKAPPKAGKMAGKRVTHVQRVLTEADPFDEIECHLTPERVAELQEPDPATGLPVLVGDWTGRATRDEETGAVIPAEYAADADTHAKKRGRKAKDAE